MKTHYQILIIGGGTGGIMTAANFLEKDKSLSVGIIEPSDKHYYQPAWTLVGAGTFDYKDTERPMASVIPKHADWIKDFATKLDPENNKVGTKNHGDISYDYLVVSPGLVMKPELIEGLPEAMDKGLVCSNYTDPEHTWDVLKKFKGGNAVFTQPSTPIKCGGAPQKIAYLAADYFRKHGLLDKTNVIFATPGTTIFGVPEIRETLEKVIDRYGMEFLPFFNPVKIDAKKQIITFKYTKPDAKEYTIAKDNVMGLKTTDPLTVEMHFDMLHLAPPQGAPEFVSSSPLSNADGWLDVDKHTLQHKKFKNVYGIGDIAGLPTAKTGAAIRKQAPIVVDNILTMMHQNHLGNKSYNGYSSCPLVTAYGKMVLAEFDYDNKFTPDPKLKQMLIFDSSKEHWRLWMLKKYGLPYLYWNKMLKGKEV